jgi:hypothetical protein
MKRMNKLVALGLMVGVGVFGVASASAGPWSAPAGSSDSFTYDSGTDINGLWGEPFVSTDTFYFVSANFQVNSFGGGTTSQTDTTMFNVHANPGLQFSLIRITANGTYAVTGDPGQNSVNQMNHVDMDEIGGFGQHFEGDMVTNPTMPVNSGNGQWSGLTVVDLSLAFPPLTDLHVEMSDDVVAISGPGGSAEINVQFSDLKIEFVVIPEPSTLALMAFGALALIRRR